MALTENAIGEIRTAVQGAARPLIFFDDDCDGTTSFVQLYRFLGDGKGIAVKANPRVDSRYVRKVDEHQPDLVVILDKPVVEEEFFDGVRTPIIWLDHHAPVPPKRENVRYYNPRQQNDEDNRPTTYWMYKITGGPLWLATVGSVADWHVPDFIEEFAEQYGDLLPEGRAVEEILFNSRLGKLARIISFNLKGSVSETMKSVKVLTRIETPYEILNQTTSRGKYLYKKYHKIAQLYESMLKRARAAATDEPVLRFTYADSSMSLTSDLSNELLYLYPEKLILIARIHNGEYKYSLRSAGKYAIPPMLERALKGIDGYGGGHTYACGACVSEDDNERFVDAIREEIAKNS